MIALTRDDLLPLVAEARLAPSVHNIQPTRWQLRDGRVLLLGDPSRSIPVADPEGRDWRLSHGTALEGLSIALSRRGLAIADIKVQDSAAVPDERGMLPIVEVTIAAGSANSSPEPTQTRASWRGAFAPSDASTQHDLDRLTLEHSDLVLVRDAASVAAIAELADRAGLHFLRDAEHRRELLTWMRLSGSHPRYETDGLNARAMHLGAFEAWGAGLVLGPLFEPLDKLSLAAPLLSEAGKTRSATGIALFHRPVGEDPLSSGRAFYRAWLAMERYGLKACPMSVLSDWPVSRGELAARYSVPADRHIVNVFRLGKPKGTPKTQHARLPVETLVV